EVHDRVALDAPGGARRGVRGKAPPKRERTHRCVLIQITEGIDCRHPEAGSRSRFGGRPRRDARDEDALGWDVHHEIRTLRDPEARARRSRRDDAQMVDHRAAPPANAHRLHEPPPPPPRTPAPHHTPPPAPPPPPAPQPPPP